MKQSNTNKSVKNVSRHYETLRKLILTLESAHDALWTHKNFGLAEAILSEYYEQLPQELEDDSTTKPLYHALKDRNRELLFASVEAELERLRLLKVNAMREKIVQRKLKNY